MAGRVTIKSIARDLGVSHMTVSRALSGSDKVRPDTRDAIVEHAARLGYVRSAAASAIRGGRSGIVGLLLPTLANEFYSRYADSLARRVNSQNRQVIIHLTTDEPSLEYQAIQKLREVQAEAVVMVPVPDPLPGTPDGLASMQIIQLIRTRTEADAVAVAGIDDADAIHQAVVHLAERGHTRIGFIGGSTELSSGYNRYHAYREGMQSRGLPVSSEFVRTSSPSFAQGASHALDLAKRNASALICAGFEISNGALNALLKQGVTLGEDIAFIGYGDPSAYRWIQGGVSTIRIPVLPLAAATAELLNQTDSKENPPVTEQRHLTAELIIRSS